MAKYEITRKTKSNDFHQTGPISEQLADIADALKMIGVRRQWIMHNVLANTPTISVSAFK